MRGQEVLKNGVKYQMRRWETTLELLIWKAVPEDSGLYKCLCADQFTSATVKVKGSKYSIAKVPHNLDSLGLNIA